MIETQTPYLGRAQNAIQDFLVQKLYIPKVYLDADWDGVPVQVLAIDRDGSGDVHAVWMFFFHPNTHNRASSFLLASELPQSIRDIQTLRCHFHYVAVISDDPELRNFSPNNDALAVALASDGVGRVGILHVDLSDDIPSVRVLLRPERFRSSKELVELANRFVTTHTANWEVRD